MGDRTGCALSRLRADSAAAAVGTHVRLCQRQKTGFVGIRIEMATDIRTAGKWNFAACMLSREGPLSVVNWLAVHPMETAAKAPHIRFR